MMSMRRYDRLGEECKRKGRRNAACAVNEKEHKKYCIKKRKRPHEISAFPCQTSTFYHDVGN